MTGEEAPSPMIRRVEEEWRPGFADRWVHPEWEAHLPWLAQGATSRGPGGNPLNFALAAEDSGGDTRSHWEALAASVGFPSILHARQVHGRHVLVHEAAPGRGLTVGPDADGHATAIPGVLLAVTVADCVPIYLVDPIRRATAILHAGWRGAVAGILEMGLGVLKGRFGSDVGDLLVHLGPAICGSCYEVGPEVHRTLGLPDLGRPAPVNLRWVLGARAITAGVTPGKLTQSSHCTLCGNSPFFSHRRGDRGRQVGYLGIRLGGRS